MKSEAEIRKYLTEVQTQLIDEEKLEHRYLVIVGETIISTLKWVLEVE